MFTARLFLAFSLIVSGAALAQSTVPDTLPTPPVKASQPQKARKETAKDAKQKVKSEKTSDPQALATAQAMRGSGPKP
jgi:hypothetical protein